MKWNPPSHSAGVLLPPRHFIEAVGFAAAPSTLRVYLLQNGTIRPPPILAEEQPVLHITAAVMVKIAFAIVRWITGARRGAAIRPPPVFTKQSPVLHVTSTVIVEVAFTGFYGANRKITTVIFRKGIFLGILEFCCYD